MSQEQSTVNRQEVAKFTQLAQAWWDPQGELRTLHQINPARLAWIQQYADLSGKRILDVGCGGGILSEALAAAGGIVSGLDADEAAIQVARDHAVQSQLAIDYQCRPIEDYDQPAFDIICCMEMLEHVDRPSQVIEHCARLLKPDGLLFLSTINRTAKAYAQAILMAEYVLRLLPRQTHDFKLFITPAELAAMLRAEDMDVQGLSGLAYNPLTGQARPTNDVTVNYMMVASSVT